MNPYAIAFTPAEDVQLLAIRAQRPPPNWVEVGLLMGRGRSTVYKRWHSLTRPKKPRGGPRGPRGPSKYRIEVDMRFRHDPPAPRLAPGITLDMVRAGR